MAISIEDTYPGRSETSSLDYPEGSFKNETIPFTSDDGTPVDNKWADDFEGMKQALMRSAGTTPTLPGDVPDTALSSQIMKAIVELASGRAYLYDDSGAANAYVLDAKSGQQNPDSLFVGMIIKFIPSATNTGASTANPFGEGVLPIKRIGGVDDVVAGDIVLGEEATLFYRASYYELVTDLAADIAAGVVGAPRIQSAALEQTGGSEAVTTAAIRDGAVTEAKLGTSSVASAKIASGAVTNAKLGSGAVAEVNLGTGSVTNTKIASGAVTALKIGSGAVSESKLAADSVIDTKIAAGAVIEAKLGTGSVTNTKIADSAVTETKIGPLAVTNAKLGSGAVTEAKIGSGAVTETKLGTSSVTEVKIGTGSVTETKIGPLAVTNAKIASAAVGQGQLKTTTGEVSGTTDSSIVNPGGAYSLGLESKVSLLFDVYSAVYGVTGDIGNTTYIAHISIKSTGETVSARVTYVQSSPPYDLGDGEIPLFIFAELNSRGDIVSVSEAPEAPWHNNGKTNIRADFYRDGKGYQYRKDSEEINKALMAAGHPSGLTAKTAKQLSMSAYVDYHQAFNESRNIESLITQSIKQADMNSIPAPMVPGSGNTVIMLDPVSDLGVKLFGMKGHDEFSICDLLHDGDLIIGSEVERSGPAGVAVHSYRWR